MGASRSAGCPSAGSPLPAGAEQLARPGGGASVGDRSGPRHSRHGDSKSPSAILVHSCRTATVRERTLTATVRERRPHALRSLTVAVAVRSLTRAVRCGGAAGPGATRRAPLLRPRPARELALDRGGLGRLELARPVDHRVAPVHALVLRPERVLLEREVVA